MGGDPDQDLQKQVKASNLGKISPEATNSTLTYSRPEVTNSTRVGLNQLPSYARVGQRKQAPLEKEWIQSRNIGGPGLRQHQGP